MIFRTHLAFAFLIGLFFDFKSLLFVLFGSLIPDLDYSKSKIGRKIVFSKLFNILFGHRKFFHSLLFALIFSFFMFLIFNKGWVFILIGLLSHIFLDCLTKQGVMVFYPFKFKIKGFIETGSIIEKALFIVFIFLITIKLLYL